MADKVLAKMGKPEHAVYQKFVKKYEQLNRQEGMNQFLVPYLMSSHPGCTLTEAVELAEYLRDLGYMPEQVQDFYPTPSTISTCMYYTGVDPRTMEPVYVPKNPHEKAMQRALIQYRNPANYELVKEALLKAHRADLIGFDAKCLIRPRPDKNRQNYQGTDKNRRGQDDRNMGGKNAGRKNTGNSKQSKWTKYCKRASDRQKRRQSATRITERRSDMSERKKIAIVTGASSGMGRAFVQQIMDKYRRLDEIWVIARHLQKEMWQERFGTKIVLLPLDLLQEAQQKRLRCRLFAEDVRVKILVNAAGMGRIGTFEEITLPEHQQTTRLNDEALMTVTYLCLPYMEKGDHIIQMASASAFVPQPGFAVYAASKAYVLSFSRALRSEVRKKVSP